MTVQAITYPKYWEHLATHKKEQFKKVIQIMNIHIDNLDELLKEGVPNLVRGKDRGNPLGMCGQAVHIPDDQ